MPAPPLELILARNLLAEVRLAVLLCDCEGTIVFLNDAAGELLGRRFEELGTLTPEQWEHEFGRSESFVASGAEVGQLVTDAARSGTPIGDNVRLRVADGHEIEAGVSVVPLSTIDGFRGAIVLMSTPRSPEG
jgi:PAS domain-containing protein